MIVYKITENGMTATRGNGQHKLHIGLNVADKANCAKEGFHAAENPLDCFNYYSSPSEKYEYYICNALGDIDEDSVDSKISCTILDILEKISLKQFITDALMYMKKYPNRPPHRLVKTESGTAENGFVIVKGKQPKAKGKKIGDILAFFIDTADGCGVGIRVVDGKKIAPGKFYNCFGVEVV